MAFKHELIELTEEIVELESHAYDHLSEYTPLLVKAEIRLIITLVDTLEDKKEDLLIALKAFKQAETTE
jgi:hypothetical protein